MSGSIKKQFENELVEIVKRVIPNQKCVITTEPGSKVGDGYLGITTLVTAEMDDNQVKHFFVKQAPQDEDFRKVLHVEEAFHREVYFYSTLKPILEEITLKHLKKSFTITPECFFTSNEELHEFLVLDNLTAKGYKIITRLNLFDEHHMKMLLSKFSQLHACGFILKQENSQFFSEMTKNMGEMFFKVCKVFEIGNYLKFSLNVVKSHCSPIEDKVILDNFDRINNNLIKAFEKVNDFEEYRTIVHIDSWMNNLMFKYKDNTRELEDLKVVDFQMCTINSPIFDVLHIFYANASTKEILDNCNYYQEYYYNSLSDYITKMNGDPSVLFPREIFLSQWKKHSYYGLLFCIIVLRGILADPNTIRDLSDMIRENTLNEAYIYALPDEQEFARRIKLILYHFIQMKFV